MRRRFFIEEFRDQRAIIQGQGAHHLGRVLRAQLGQLYELSDGARVFLGRIETVDRHRIEFALLEELPAQQPRFHTTLLLSVVKFDAFEWAIEKATELGVGCIVPVAAARSEKALLGGVPKRAERWKKILLEASEQSRRVQVPTLDPLVKSEVAFSSHKKGYCVLLSESVDAPPLRKLLANQQTDSAVLAIGPEGGWTGPEFIAARSASYQEASLGKLILRTETAVAASLASLNFALASD
jgi:16S rRNA (uracil1498-N3)-methyltransferase